MDRSNIKFDKIFGTEWMKIKEFSNYVQSKTFVELLKKVAKSYNKNKIYPNKEDIFRIFRNTDPKNITVVILGQEPYTTGNANGYAFANNDDVLNVSPALLKILENVENYNKKVTIDPDVTLQNWVDQGVFLYNTSLTVQEGIVNGHLDIWKDFTSFILNLIVDNNRGVIFCLWGNKAQQVFNSSVSPAKLKFLYKLTSPHPAYAADRNLIWDCDHFKEVNDIIKNQNGIDFKINW